MDPHVEGLHWGRAPTSQCRKAEWPVKGPGQGKVVLVGLGRAAGQAEKEAVWWVQRVLSQTRQGQSQRPSLLWGGAMSGNSVIVSQGSLPGGRRATSGFDQ